MRQNQGDCRSFGSALVAQSAMPPIIMKSNGFIEFLIFISAAMVDVSIADRADDSDDLGDDCRGKGIKQVWPHKKNRKENQNTGYVNRFAVIKRLASRTLLRLD